MAVNASATVTTELSGPFPREFSRQPNLVKFNPPLGRLVGIALPARQDNAEFPMLVSSWIERYIAREVLQMLLARRQIQIRGGFAMSQTPDVGLLDGVVAPRILDAMRIASSRLRELGIRHALVGALGVGAHGYPRATKDVDFLVGDEAFQQHAGGLVSITAGVPIQVGDVPVDPLSLRSDEPHLLAALAQAVDRKSVV